MFQSFFTFPMITSHQIMTPREEWICWIKDASQDPPFTKDGDLPFDVIPVIQDGEVVGLISINCLEIQPITLDWCLTHDAPIEQLIHFFNQKKKPACFLLSGDDFVGLVTPADLNKSKARLAIYFMLAELEIRLANFIRYNRLSEKEILTKLGNKRQEEIKRLQIECRKTNVDVDLLEQLHLHDLLAIIEKHGRLREKLGFHSRSEYKRLVGAGGLIDLRNKIMHPVRPLVEDTSESLNALHDRLFRIKNLLSLLDSQNNPTKYFQKYRDSQSFYLKKLNEREDRIPLTPDFSPVEGSAPGTPVPPTTPNLHSAREERRNSP